MRFWIFVLVVSLLTACTHRKPIPADPTATNSTPVNPTPAPYATEANSSPNEEVSPPQKATGNPEHIGLVLGGAGVASFATVGLLKRFQEEGIIVDYIVTTGWPTLFALGFSYSKSVHDLEWFAARLQEKDFYKVGIFDAEKGYASHEKLSSLVESSFKQQGLEEGKIPVIISSTNTDPGDPEISDRGDWRIPLLKTMSVPGIFKPYPAAGNKEWISSIQGMDVAEALKRGAKTIVAVEMYNDYFAFLKAGKKDGSDQVFRKLYLNQLKKSIAQELAQATIVGRIHVGISPTDFSSKRTAIFTGYREGAKLAKLIRK